MTAMDKLPPHVQARVKELVDAAPPLSPAQRDLIRRIFAPVVRQLAEQRAAGAS